MCKEVLQMVQKMDSRSVETRLAIHCAPVICGIKTSNLFMVETSREMVLRNLLKHSGLSYYRLLRSNDKTAWLLFRRSSLEEYLRTEEVSDMLLKLGYKDLSFGQILRSFQARYQMCMEQGKEFPHEMGLLLGYPFEDVVGFMKDGGQHSLYTGYWKVYHNVPEKKKIFHSYDEAQLKLIHYLAEGKSLPLILDIYKNSSRERAALQEDL